MATTQYPKFFLQLKKLSPLSYYTSLQGLQPRRYAAFWQLPTMPTKTAILILGSNKEKYQGISFLCGMGMCRRLETNPARHAKVYMLRNWKGGDIKDFKCSEERHDGLLSYFHIGLKGKVELTKPTPNRRDNASMMI